MLDNRWPAGDLTRVPYWLYRDEAVYERERERLFLGAAWNFVGLDCEIPAAGDYKTTFIGDVPVIMVRDEDGDVQVLENRCAHRGALVCLKRFGNARRLTCVYHAWSYDHRGKLVGLAFRNGVNGEGGMPAEFDPTRHGLRRYRVEVFCGLVFATLDQALPPVEEHLGAEIAGRVRRVFRKPVRVLGYGTQVLPNNWKLYIENVKDTYHAGLLHLFFATFKLNRLTSEGGVIVSEDGGNHASFSKRRTIHANAEYDDAKLRASRDDVKLADASLLDSFDEFGDGINVQILSVFPNFILQQVENSIAVRQVLPKGVGQAELNWVILGFQDDDEKITKMRLKQANLIGPAGYISMEDGAVGGFVQRAIQTAGDEASLMEMGGRDHTSDNTRTTEASVRGFWNAYRMHMSI